VEREKPGVGDTEMRVEEESLFPRGKEIGGDSSKEQQPDRKAKRKRQEPQPKLGKASVSRQLVAPWL